jgi:hypothetical protein
MPLRGGFFFAPRVHGQTLRFHCVRLFPAPRVRGQALRFHCVRLFVARRVRGQALRFHCVRLFFAPRASSGRSGWASGPALRPAFACDPACGGTQPGMRTLAVPLPRMRRSVGSSVSTRRSGRSVPARSGAMALLARGADFTTTLPFAAEPAQTLWRVQDFRVAETSIPTSGGGRSAGAAGWLFMALRAGFCFARRVRGQALLFHSVRLFFAPRATSGRSGCASSAALRPASACDPACGGTQPGMRTLAVPLPRMRRSVGSSVSTRRSGRSVPARFGAMALLARGADLPTTPRSRLKRSIGPATEQLGPGFNVSSRRVGVSNRPAGASGHTSGGCGDPARESRLGYR